MILLPVARRSSLFPCSGGMAYLFETTERCGEYRITFSTAYGKILNIFCSSSQQCCKHGQRQTSFLEETLLSQDCHQVVDQWTIARWLMNLWQKCTLNKHGTIYSLSLITCKQSHFLYLLHPFDISFLSQMLTIYNVFIAENCQHFASDT